MTILDFKGRKVYIHSEAGTELASTVITDFDSNHMTITVRGTLGEITNGSTISLLIVSEGGVFEYLGKTRRDPIDPSSTMIGLFKGGEKENRKAARYTVNTGAVVESLIIGEETAPLLNPLKVSVVNLSASGALIRAMPNCFTLQSVIEIQLPIADKMTRIYAKVVRTKGVDHSIAEYGCSFVSIN